MTDNCIEGKDVLITPPKLLDNAQLKINPDIMDSISQSSVASLFKQGGIPLSKLLGSNCFSKSGIAEVKTPNPIVNRLSLGLAYKDGACFVNLRCPF